MNKYLNVLNKSYYFSISLPINSSKNNGSKRISDSALRKKKVRPPWARAVEYVNLRGGGETERPNHTTTAIETSSFLVDCSPAVGRNGNVFAARSCVIKTRAHSSFYRRHGSRYCNYKHRYPTGGAI